MNWTAVWAWKMACVFLSAGFGWTLGAWWHQRRRRREVEGRIARAIIEVALVRAHLLHFPTQWHAPLKALKCAEKALETLEGTERPAWRDSAAGGPVARMTIHKAATCGASEVDGKAADRGT